MIINEITPKVRLLGRELVRELGVVDSASSPGSVTLTQSHILIELLRSGTLTANELAELLIVDKSAISRSVNHLIDMGFISLRINTSDQRRKPLALTTLGTRRALEIHNAADSRVKQALSLLDSDELKAVTHGMSLYVKALHRARLQKDLRIRLIGKGDSPDIIKLINIVSLEFSRFFEENEIDSIDDKDIYKAFSSSKSKFYIIERQGRIVGCGGFRPMEGSKQDSTCELRYVNVLAEVRGLGIGGIILKRCLEEAKHLGYGRCHVEVKPYMINAHNLLDRFGFSKFHSSRLVTKNTGHILYAKELDSTFQNGQTDRKPTSMSREL